jgi:hypothetical protein
MYKHKIRGCSESKKINFGEEKLIREDSKSSSYNIIYYVRVFICYTSLN